MARSFAEIQTEILNEKSATPELLLLNSTSATAVWRLWVNVIARCMVVMEQLWDLASVILQRKADTLHVGTALWYVEMAKKFEIGNATLGVDVSTYQVRYLTSNPSLRIIKFAAITGAGRVAVLKVAKDNGSGLPQKLSATELNEFSAYLDRIKFAGSQIVAQSLNADLLKLEGTVYYDGAQYTASAIQTAVEQAIKQYLQNLPFNGNLYRNALIDAMQNVAGVLDIDVDVLQGATYLANYVDIDRTYQPLSGYLVVGSLSINYVAE